MPASKPKSIQSVTKSHEIIEALQRMRIAGVSELGEEVDLHPSTVHAHLTSLRKTGLVMKEGSKYKLSLHFLRIGGQLRNEIPIYNEGWKEVDTIARETGEMANIGIEEQGELVVVYMAEGEKAIDKRTPIGKRNNLHCTGMGKAILAELPEDQVKEIIDTVELTKETTKTITNEDVLFDELKKTRKRGFALDKEEIHEGVHCIATSVKKDGHPVGAISVTGPKSRFTDNEYREKMKQVLLESANVIELNLKFHN